MKLTAVIASGVRETHSSSLCQLGLATVELGISCDTNDPLRALQRNSSKALQTTLRLPRSATHTAICLLIFLILPHDFSSEALELVHWSKPGQSSIFNSGQTVRPQKLNQGKESLPCCWSLVRDILPLYREVPFSCNDKQMSIFNLKTSTKQASSSLQFDYFVFYTTQGAIRR